MTPQSPRASTETGSSVALQLEPGLFAGAEEYNEDQKLGEVWLRTAGSWHDQNPQTWGQVSEVASSEIVLDLLR